MFGQSPTCPSVLKGMEIIKLSTGLVSCSMERGSGSSTLQTTAWDCSFTFWCGQKSTEEYASCIIKMKYYSFYLAKHLVILLEVLGEESWNCCSGCNTHSSSNNLVHSTFMEELRSCAGVLIPFKGEKRSTHLRNCSEIGGPLLPVCQCLLCKIFGEIRVCSCSFSRRL